MRTLLSAKDLGIKEAQRRNLALAGLFLNTLYGSGANPANLGFRMGWYYKDARRDTCDDMLPADAAKAVRDGLLVTACVGGHGPLAGIGAKAGEDWHSYRIRVFGAGAESLGGIYDKVFDSKWPDCPLDAARRIAHLLEWGPNMPDGDGAPRYEPDWAIVRELASRARRVRNRLDFDPFAQKI